MKSSRKVALAFWATLSGLLVAELFFYQAFMASSGYAALTAVLMAAIALTWLLLDADENKIRLGALLKIATVIAAVIALPYYRFRYFGARAGFRFIAINVGSVLGLLMLMTALDWVVYLVG